MLTVSLIISDYHTLTILGFDSPCNLTVRIREIWKARYCLFIHHLILKFNQCNRCGVGDEPKKPFQLRNGATLNSYLANSSHYDVLLVYVISLSEMGAYVPVHLPIPLKDKHYITMSIYFTGCYFIRIISISRYIDIRVYLWCDMTIINMLWCPSGSGRHFACQVQINNVDMCIRKKCLNGGFTKTYRVENTICDSYSPQ